MIVDKLIDKIDETISYLENNQYRRASRSAEDVFKAYNDVTTSQTEVIRKAKYYQGADDASLDYIRDSGRLSSLLASAKIQRMGYVSALSDWVRRPTDHDLNNLKEVSETVKDNEKQISNDVQNLEDRFSNFSSELPPLFSIEISMPYEGHYPRDKISTFYGKIRNYGEKTANAIEYSMSIQKGVGEISGTIDSIGPGEEVKIHSDFQPLYYGRETATLSISSNEVGGERQRLDFDVSAEAGYIDPVDKRLREVIELIQNEDSISGSGKSEIISYLILARAQLATASVIILARVGMIDPAPDFEFEINTVTNLLLLGSEINIGQALLASREYRRNNNVPSDVSLQIETVLEESINEIQTAKEAGVDKNPDSTQVIERYKTDVERLSEAEDNAEEITTDSALSREEQIDTSIKSFDILSYEKRVDKVELSNYQFDEKDWGIGYKIE
jgi:uncharacterized phage infection (PIP) family protein YhgE